MTFQTGDIVKFNGNEEPCVVYRVLDSSEVLIEFALGRISPELLPHIRLEVIGLVPTELLRHAANHNGNMFALDKAMMMNKQLN